MLLGLVGIFGRRLRVRALATVEPAERRGFHRASPCCSRRCWLPATRFGYLIYPLDLLTCAVLLATVAPSDAREPELVLAGQSPSGTSKSLSVRFITAEVTLSPASAGDSDGLDGAISAPTSHS